MAKIYYGHRLGMETTLQDIQAVIPKAEYEYIEQYVTLVEYQEILNKLRKIKIVGSDGCKTDGCEGRINYYHFDETCLSCQRKGSTNA